MTTIEERAAKIMRGVPIYIPARGDYINPNEPWIHSRHYEALAHRVAELEANVEKWSRDATEIANYTAIRLEAAEAMAEGIEATLWVDSPHEPDEGLRMMEEALAAYRATQ